MGVLIKMLVQLKPVEVWVELPDYVDEGIGQAAEDAERLLRSEGVRDFIGSEGRLPVALEVESADSVWDDNSFIVRKG